MVKIIENRNKGFLILKWTNLGDNCTWSFALSHIFYVCNKFLSRIATTIQNFSQSRKFYFMYTTNHPTHFFPESITFLSLLNNTGQQFWWSTKSLIDSKSFLITDSESEVHFSVMTIIFTKFAIDFFEIFRDNRVSVKTIR